MTTLGLEAWPEAGQSPDVRLRQWLAGGFAVGLLTMLVWWGTTVESRFDEMRNTLSERGERQAAGETMQVVQQKQLDEIKAAMNQMNAKLDRLIERDVDRLSGRRFDR